MSGWPEWPYYGLENDLLPAAEACVAGGEEFALATLVQIRGASPRPLGAEMLIAASGSAHGYVSGGCVEAAVVSEAIECLRIGRPRLLDYGHGSDIVDIQLTCGGRIGIFVRPVENPAWWIAQLREVRLARCARNLRIDLQTGEMAVDDGEATTGTGCFLQQYLPPVRLVLVGSDPVTLATAMLADALGMEVVLWRPDGPAAPPVGMHLQAYRSSGLVRGTVDLPLDKYTALYCLTHDMTIDVMMLRHALASDAFVVGVLGSRTKRQARLQQLQESGVTARQLERLSSPAGMAIGATTPQEIALSILAEVIERRPKPLCRDAVVVPSSADRAYA